MAEVRHGLTADLFQVVRSELGFTELSVAFQPIMNLATGRLFAFEALARVKHPSFQGPVALIECALGAQMIGELGRLLRRIAVERCPHHPLFLNIHPTELDEGWLTRPDDPIFLHDHQVYLEITESVPMSPHQYCMATLREVKARGARLVVDDLGAGYSNLKYIADLAPHVVKLDRQLVASIAKDQRTFLLVRAITRLCVDLGAEVVAEGIETKAELDAAKLAGAHYGQGYFLGKPDSVPKIGALAG